MSGNKGFTLTELLIGIGILLVVLAVAVPLILRHMENARAGQVKEQVMHIRTALNSYISRIQALPEPDSSGDYLPALVQAGEIDTVPSMPACSQWHLRMHEDESGKKAFYVEVDFSNCPDNVVEGYKKILAALDEEYDDGNYSGGDFIILM